MNTLAIVGPYPPHYGGVSVHIQRLRTRLIEKRIPFVVYNTGSDAIEQDGTVVTVCKGRGAWLLKYLFCGCEEVVYFHAPRIESFIACAWLSVVRRKRTLICLHNPRFLDRCTASAIGKLGLALLCRPVHMIICVNQHIYTSLQDIGVPKGKLLLNPAFIPPKLERVDLPTPVESFVNSHSRIISANGRIAWFNGRDLYGIDTLIRVMDRIRDIPGVGLIFYFWNFEAKDTERLDFLRSEIHRLGLEKDILFHIGHDQFVPVLARSSVFVRPTLTDGDALSIREALCLGIPTIASDASERPPGTLMFNCEDVDSLVRPHKSHLGHQLQPEANRELLRDETERTNRYLHIIESAMKANEPSR